MFAVENGARGGDTNRSVVILTDGTTRSQDTVSAAQKLRREKNARIFVVKIGELFLMGAETFYENNAGGNQFFIGRKSLCQVHDPINFLGSLNSIDFSRVI